MKKTIKEKKRLFMISLVIIGLIASLVSSVSKDWVNILENNSQINEKTREYEALLLNEKKLKSEVTKLQDSEYVARFAKEKYMYSSDGETIIRMD
ncbi:MAG: septum formation initiator family protein [Bacilli bacterium]